MKPFLAALLAGVVPVSSAGPSAHPDTLTVYAAASLTDAFTELGRRMEADHAGLTVRFNFAGSQQLATQIEQGAPADLFASADQRWMDFLVERSLIEDRPRVFARNRLVVIVPGSNPAGIGKLQDLVRGGVKLVVAAEDVPAGKYSREVIGKLAGAPGFPRGYADRVLGNVVSQEENVKSVVAKVQLGEADAGLVYRSDVTPAVARRVRVLDIPDEFNAIASYPIAIVRKAEPREAAGWFLDLVTADAGQRILERHGLLTVEAAAPVGSAR